MKRLPRLRLRPPHRWPGPLDRPNFMIVNCAAVYDFPSDSPISPVNKGSDYEIGHIPVANKAVHEPVALVPLRHHHDRAAPHRLRTQCVVAETLVTENGSS